LRCAVTRGVNEYPMPFYSLGSNIVNKGEQEKLADGEQVDHSKDER